MPPHDPHETSPATQGAQEHPVVLFDGECALCSASARFVVKRDPRAVFRFAALQSETGRRLLGEYGLSRDETDSIVLIDKRRARVRSGAALRVARRLRFPWPALAGLLAVPAPIRDCVYDFIAKRRYTWFGKVELCDTSDEMRERLIDDAEASSGSSSGANAGAGAHPA